MMINQHWFRQHATTLANVDQILCHHIITLLFHWALDDSSDFVILKNTFFSIFVTYFVLYCICDVYIHICLARNKKQIPFVLWFLMYVAFTKLIWTQFPYYLPFVWRSLWFPSTKSLQCMISLLLALISFWAMSLVVCKMRCFSADDVTLS